MKYMLHHTIHLKLYYHIIRSVKSENFEISLQIKIPLNCLKLFTLHKTIEIDL